MQDNETAIRSYIVHSFEYHGICVEIKEPVEKTEYSHFTYYLYLCLNKFADQRLANSLWLRAKRLRPEFPTKYYPYGDIALFQGIDFHGGVTYYSKHCNLSDEKIIQIGCDYGHLWDIGRFYALEGVIADARRSVDSLHSLAVYGQAEKRDEEEETTNG